MAVDTTQVSNPTARAALEALQAGDAPAWTALFEPGAQLFDDGAPRDIGQFTRDALGHERFTLLEHFDAAGLQLTGQFHSDQWGDFRTRFQFHLSPAGRIIRLDIGEA